VTNYISIHLEINAQNVPKSWSGFTDIKIQKLLNNNGSQKDIIALDANMFG
jgi:hypothetical protein